MAKWISAGYLGLRYTEHPTRTTGIAKHKRPYRYYGVSFKMDGKTREDIYGWEYDFQGGIHEIETIATQLRANRKNRTPPYTYREMIQGRIQEEQAQAEAAEAQAAEDAMYNRLLFGNVFQEYQESSPGTRSIKEMKGFYVKWLEHDLNDKHLSEIKLLDLQRIQKRMEKDGRAPRTIKTIKEVVRQVYNYAIEHELYFGVKPTDNFLKKLKLNNRRQKCYTVEQADELLMALKKRSMPLYHMTLLALNTGMRFGEIVALRWQHVNLDQRTIFIADPKNEESRTIPMVKTVADLFNEIPRGNPGDLLFPSRKPEKHDGIQQKISDTFPRTVDALGFNEGITDRRLRLGFHSLRHTNSSWMARDGVEVTTRAAILGHKTLDMNVRYSHVDYDTMVAAMESIEKQQVGVEKARVVPLKKKA